MPPVLPELQAWGHAPICPRSAGGAGSTRRPRPPTLASAQHPASPGPHPAGPVPPTLPPAQPPGQPGPGPPRRSRPPGQTVLALVQHFCGGHTTTRAVDCPEHFSPCGWLVILHVPASLPWGCQQSYHPSPPFSLPWTCPLLPSGVGCTPAPGCAGAPHPIQPRAWPPSCCGHSHGACLLGAGQGPAPPQVSWPAPVPACGLAVLGFRVEEPCALSTPLEVRPSSRASPFPHRQGGGSVQH